jgi:iron complex outermembrane recepter protein
MIRNTLTLLMVSSAAWSLAAHAQSTGASSTSQNADDGAIGEIIVTAQRRSEKLSDVPLSLTVATGERLAAHGVSSPDDLQKIVPGFTYQRSSYGVPVYTIRGVGFLDTALGVAPTVSIYVDQVPLAFSPMAAGATLDVERVEALKGPQGTLFGENSTGGAVNYIAAKPTADFHAGGDISFGRFSSVEAQGYVSGPLSSTLKARLAVRTEQSGDWQYSYTRHATLGERHFTTGRLLLDWNPTDNARFEFNINGWKDTSDTQAAQFFGYQPTAVPPSNPAPGIALTNYPLAPRNARAAEWNAALDGQLKRNDHFYQLALHADIDLSDAITVSSITQWSDYKTDAKHDPDGVNFPSLQIFKSGKLQTFSQETRFLGKAMEDRLAWMVGASYQYGNIVDNEVIGDAQNLYTATNDTYFGIDIQSLRNNNTQKIDTYAVFGSLDYKLTDTITAQGSIRYTKEDRIFNGCTYDTDGTIYQIVNILGSFIGIPPTAVQGGCFTFDSVALVRLPIYTIPLKEDNVSWRGGLSWKPNSDSMIYANVTKGYKGGSFPTITASDAQLFGAAKQEGLLAYEAGFRTSLANRSVDISGAVFHYDYTGKQVLGLLQTVFGNLPKLVNIPKSKVDGAEFDVTFRPTKGLSINGGATYIKSKVTSSMLLSNAFGQIVDVRGESFPNTPKWQLHGDLQYQFPVSDSLDVFFGTNAQYRTSAQAGFGRLPQFILKAYGTLDLRAGVESSSGNWRAEIWGRNVTNTLYWNNIAKLTDTFSRTTGMPVTYGVRVGYKF